MKVGLMDQPAYCRSLGRSWATPYDQILKKMIAGALLSSGFVAAGLGLAAGTAQAYPGPAPLDHFTWCPGHPDPRDHISPGGPIAAMQREGWDLSVCHDYWYPAAGLPDSPQHNDIVEGDHVPRGPACAPLCAPWP
jgi:hypothetical protein